MMMENSFLPICQQRKVDIIYSATTLHRRNGYISLVCESFSREISSSLQYKEATTGWRKFGSEFHV